MIWLVIEQKSQGYTNTGTRRQTQRGTTGRDLVENHNEREHLRFKTLRETEAAARDRPVCRRRINTTQGENKNVNRIKNIKLHRTEKKTLTNPLTLI